MRCKFLLDRLRRSFPTLRRLHLIVASVLSIESILCTPSSGNKLSVANNSKQGLENFQPAGPGQEQDPPEIAPEDGIESREGSAAPDSRQSIEASDSEQELGNDEIESLEDKNVPAANTA